MITVVIHERPTSAVAAWMEEGTTLGLKASPEGIEVSFISADPDAIKVELLFHPSMLYILAEYAKAQPANTFMPKEGERGKITRIS